MSFWQKVVLRILRFYNSVLGYSQRCVFGLLVAAFYVENTLQNAANQKPVPQSTVTQSCEPERHDLVEIKGESLGCKRHGPRTAAVCDYSRG